MRHSSDRPWVTDAFRCLVKERQAAHIKDQKEKYNVLRNKVNRMAHSLRSKFYRSKVANLKTENPKQWWKDVKALMGKSDNSSSGITSLANNLTDGSIDDLASRINEFFKSVSESLEPLTSDSPYLNLPIDHVPSEYIISVSNVEKHLIALNPRKASGPDKLPGWIIRDFAGVL